METVLALKNVNAEIGSYRILDDASVGFSRGSFTAIMGAAGSGKSTLLKVAAGLIVPTGGEVLFEGRNLHHLSRKEEFRFRRESAFVFQDAALWSNQTIRENLELPLKLHHPELTAAQMEAIVRRCCEETGCSAELGERPSDLSAGEQKFVALARALVNDPRILFLDEPTSSVDDTAARKMYDLIRSLHRGGKTVIVVTHSETFASRGADHLCVVRGGRIAASGPYRETAAAFAGQLETGSKGETSL
jgi:phospholipid/cholesterol/gamma-HCH transport system ATP-binding protein